MEIHAEGWSPSSTVAIDSLLDDPNPWLRGLAYFIHGQIAYNFGRIHLLEDSFDKALAGFREAGDRWGLSFTLTSQAEILGRRGEHRAAVELFEEGVRLNEELGGGTGSLLHVTMKLANELDLVGERDRAEALLLAALSDADGTRRPEEAAALHFQLGEFARRSGDHAEALRRLSHADDLTAGLTGPPQFRAMILCARGQLDIELGAVDEARTRLGEALRTGVQSHDHPIVAYVLGGHAELGRPLSGR